jgi:hypothetical protein
MGIVYVLTNEAMPGLVKIGITESGLPERMLSLDSTSVPLPFECYYAARVEDSAMTEKALHTAFGDHRVRPSREFFELDPYRAKAVLELLAVEDVTPRDEIVGSEEDSDALEKARSHSWMRPIFRFSLAHIPVGATLTFSRAAEHTALVVDERVIQFRGQETSLTGAAKVIMAELGYNWRTMSGPSMWLYEGKTLDERRREFEDRLVSDE